MRKNGDQMEKQTCGACLKLLTSSHKYRLQIAFQGTVTFVFLGTVQPNRKKFNI